MSRFTLMLLSLTLCAVLAVAAPTRVLTHEEDLPGSVSLLDTQEKASRHYTNENWDGNSFHGQTRSFEPHRAAIRDYKKALAKANEVFGDDGTEDVSSTPNEDAEPSNPFRMSYADFLKTAKDMSTSHAQTRTQKKRATDFQQLVKQGEAVSNGNIRASEIPGAAAKLTAHKNRMHKLKQRIGHMKQRAEKLSTDRTAGLRKKQRALKQHIAKHHAIHRDLGDSAEVTHSKPLEHKQHKAHKQHVKPQRKPQHKAVKKRFHSDLLEMGGDDNVVTPTNPFDPMINLLEDSEGTTTMSTAALQGMLKKLEAVADRAKKDELKKQQESISTKAIKQKLRANKAANKAFAKKLEQLEHMALEQA